MVDLGRLFLRGQDILAESNRLIARQSHFSMKAQHEQMN